MSADCANNPSDRWGGLGPGEPELDARMASYQLAARMQVSATDALDLARETRETQRLYGLDDPTTASYGRTETTSGWRERVPA